MKDKLPVVAIVGRPNVGKSTLFNRIFQRRHAIVADFPGVTRDRIEGEAEWSGRRFLLVDTGGMEGPGELVVKGGRGREKPVPLLVKAAEEQARKAIRDADLILFVVDGREGLNPADHEIARTLRRAGSKVILVANKIDEGRLAGMVHDFHALGMGEPVGVSAEHGYAMGDLLDQIVAILPEGPEEADSEEAIRVSIIGRPNVGKSSLLNRLIGRERAIVSDVAGTTREALDAVWRAGKSTFRLVDTAGLRRRARVDSPVEYYGNRRTLRAVEESDVVLFVLDATQPVTEQDKKIIGYAHENGRASIIVVNKWDAVEKTDGTAEAFTENIRYALPFIPYAPIIFVSALTGLRLGRLPQLVETVAANHARRLETPVLNKLIVDAQALHHPPGRKGRRLKIYYATQVKTKPPTIACFVNEPELVHYSYVRYLENRIRETWDFTGTPIRLRFRRRR